MKCPSCGVAIPSDMSTPATSAAGKAVNAAVTAASAGGAKLKAMGRKRPDLQSHGMTRGGKYAKD